MSLWSGLSEFFSSPEAVSFLAMSGVSLYTSEQSREANYEAARVAAEATNRQAEETRRANDIALQQYEEIKAQTAPAQSYLRRVMVTDPSRLTPGQEQQLEDARRDTGAALAANGLRGAGRATVAAIKATDSNIRDRAFNDNQDRADSAALALSNQYGQAVSSAADVTRDTGRSTGAAYGRVGDISADATTANATLRGQAIGDIASLARTSWKDQQRESRYADRLKEKTTL